MKRILFVFIALTFFITGCSLTKSSVENTGNQVVSNSQPSCDRWAK
jgi:PBP1b-binding outer membrane lipoprotein LpoB